MSILQTNITDFRILPGARIKLLISNCYELRQHSQVTTKFHSQKFCLLSNSFIKLSIHNPSGSLHYDPSIILTQGQYICPLFHLFPYLSFSLPYSLLKLHIVVFIIFLCFICRAQWVFFLKLFPFIF